MLAGAARAVLYIGVGVRRHGLTGLVVRLAERLRLPVVTDLLGKSTFPESHPQCAGVYMGALSDPFVRELVDGSDCVLGIGVALTDLGTGFWTQANCTFSEDHDRSTVGSSAIPPVRQPPNGPGCGCNCRACSGWRSAGPVLCRGMPRRRVAMSDRANVAMRPGPGRPVRAGVIRVADLIDVLQGLDQSQYSFVADVGDSWFISLELRADVYVAAGYYSSMGFAIPAALGAGIAEPARRPFAIVGDGAFQMTGTELATLVDQKLRAIVLLLNNGGYGMMEAIDGPRPYYDRRDWDYPALARAWGATAERVTDVSELRGTRARRGFLRHLSDRGDHSPRRSLASDESHPQPHQVGWACSAGSLIGERQNRSGNVN